MKLLRVLIWSLLLLAASLGALVGSCARADALTFEYTSPATLWAFVCEQGDGCAGLAEPRVQFSALGAEIGAFGMFQWTRPDRIQIDLPFAWAYFGKQEAVDSVIVHEMQHYYDFHRGLIPGIPTDRETACRAEASAFETQADYLLLNFAEQYVDVTWRLRYGC